MSGTAPARFAHAALALVCACASAGCLAWRPGWEGFDPGSGASAPAQLLEDAERLHAAADDEARVRAAIAAQQRALTMDPGHRQALERLGELHVLLGAAYLQSRQAKKAAYLAAIGACERAMALDPTFRAAVESGASVEEAGRHLGRDHAGAMFWWITAVSYLFKECQSPPQRVVNFRWMKRTQGLLERLGELDWGYLEGGVPFTWGVYYLALPRAVGGDLERSAASFAEAVEMAPSSLLHRWGRAKYLHTKTGHRAAFEADLQWVVAQDPRQATSPYRWNVYFQRDARTLLAAADRLF
ncbi:MAG TPA: TRAP transporter TatT component family protein [Thermoanaerobaculaceae bacterium]|nr:TRAP transporter TatT component family protein [Thermoanaerobaculaceae bacterium]HRS15073.1 TRAP transporter TatT component family protein [Thermoanaerobaculaceae bacterium]